MSLFRNRLQTATDHRWSAEHSFRNTTVGSVVNRATLILLEMCVDNKAQISNVQTWIYALCVRKEETRAEMLGMWESCVVGALREPVKGSSCFIWDEELMWMKWQGFEVITHDSILCNRLCTRVWNLRAAYCTEQVKRCLIYIKWT
jgi:hypothetical protein